MDKDSVLHILQNLFSDIEVHDELTPELAAILSASGSEARFFKTLVMQLQILLNTGALASNRPDFEVVGKGIFSMKQKSSEYNIRILYSFLPSRVPVLLCAFYESFTLVTCITSFTCDTSTIPHKGGENKQ